MKVTLAQIAPKLNRSNLDDIIEITQKYSDESDMIVFPELSLNGYLLQDKLYEDAWIIEELEYLKELSLGIDIVVGGAMKDGKVFRNAALYFSQGKFLSQHNKVHLPNYGMFEEARYFSAGEEFEGFNTEHGKVSMLVCEDLWHASVHNELYEQNPDYIVVLVASPARGFLDEELLIQEQWYSLIKSVALQCSAKVIFVNRVGFEDGLGFWGGSCIVNSDSRVLHKLENYKSCIETFEI